MKIKILAIVPYAGLKDIVLKAAELRDDVAIDVVEGDGDMGVCIAMSAKEKGYDVILSRGGTAIRIREVVDLPVASIEITAYDMIRLMKTVDGFIGKAVIVGYKNITNCAGAVSELMGQDIDVFTINRHEEAKECLMKLKQDNYDLVIGDLVTFETAKKLNLNSILIASDVESVSEGIEAAVKLYHIYKDQRHQIELYQSILNISEEYVYCCNNNGKKYMSNLPEDMFEELIKQIKPYLEKIEDLEYVEQLVQFDKKNWFLKISKIVLSSEESAIMSILKPCNWNIQSSIGVLTIYQDLFKSFHDYNLYFGSNENMQDINETIAAFSQSKMQILILGEVGVGKHAIAHLIHKTGAKKMYPLFEIDCQQLDEKSFESVFSEANSGLYEFNGASVFFMNIDYMNRELQNKTYRFVESVQGIRNFQIICSASPEIIKNVNNGKFNKKLFQILSTYILRIPPLRERRDSINSIVNLQIHELNIKLGSRVVGMEPKAMELMKQYNWEGNISQLKRVIRELVSTCNKTYIDEKQVKLALEREYDLGLKKHTASISLEGTLDEITQRIITKVLEDENMNQSRTAKRLDISRSTLWRIIK